MGRRHAKALATVTSDLYIVDPGETARLAARREHPKADVVDHLEALDERRFLWGSAIAIIATWGPAHAKMFHALVDRGVRKILCEKPLATSVAEADAMIRRAAEEGTTLVSNHYFRNSGYVASLVSLSEAHGFGPPLMMSVVGGAYCLVTNGIHWIDVAIQLFGSRPESVMSTAHGDPINPRSRELLHFGGSAIWRFRDGRELVMALTNRSSVHPVIQVHFRDGVVEIDEEFDVTLRRRPADAIASGAPVTRTGTATDVLFTGPLPGVLSMEDALRDGISRLMNGGESLSPADAAGAALNACLGALAAAEDGGPLRLPLAPDGPWGRREWPIT
jgi:predicted dehydrogenase